jgi:hypothetical protein
VSAGGRVRRVSRSIQLLAILEDSLAGGPRRSTLACTWEYRAKYRPELLQLKPLGRS